MAYIIGTGIIQNGIDAHNSTHKDVHGTSNCHNDGPDYSLTGVKQVLTNSTPTTLDESATLFNDAKALYNVHLSRGGAELILAHKLVDNANIVTATMDPGPTYTNALFLALRALVSDEQVCYSNHIANLKPDGTASGVHVVADTTNTLGGLDPLNSFIDIAVALNNLKLNYNNHIIFSVGASPHANPDVTNGVTAPNCLASDYDTMITLANQFKAKYNAHRTQATVHTINDTFNIVTAADVSNPGGVFDLAVQFKAKFNAHVASTTYHNVADATYPLTYSGPTTIAGLIAAAVEVLSNYNGHIGLAPITNAMVVA